MSLDLPIESVEKTEEDKQAEKDEMNLILASINKSVVDKTEKEQDSLFSLEKKVVAEEKFTLVKNNKSSIKPKDISVGFKGLIAQSKENLYGQPRTFTPQQTSSSASSSARPTLYTQMCRSVISGKKCYHKECRFAHTYDQLCVCRFDSSCRLIAKVRDGGWFKNLPSRNTGKICTCKHSSECEASYLKRLNINQTPKR